MKQWKKCCLGLSGGIICMLTACYIVTLITPNPVCYLTRKAFDGGEEGVAYGFHPDYEMMKNSVHVERDLTYESKYENATFDLYVPKDSSQSYPLVLWIHGGAFVGGDKKDLTAFATALASQGFVVLCMNYALAPEHTYPIPLKQTIELSNVILKLSEPYPIKKDEVFVGGDSAGAHIALQFVLTQVNQEYREFMHIDQILPAASIKGFISFCGLLDILAYDQTDSSLSNFLYAQSAWAYVQSKNWKQAAQENGADLLPYINRDLPPVYLTDGDSNSFLPQAKKVKELLRKQGVKVNDLLWESGEHIHEYQFHLDQDAGMKNFEMVLGFLRECSK